MISSPLLHDSRAAWLLAGVEFFFSLSWVVYVIFLPELLTRGGIDQRYVPWFLAADQLVFALSDWSVGVALDRARAALRRIGPLLVLLSTLSALAMWLLPLLAGMPMLFLLMTTLWVATSSALRAPPYVLLSRYAGRSSIPRLAGIQLLGLAIAASLAPYLAIVLKGVDAALPFLLSALAVGFSALALAYVERSLPAAQSVVTSAKANAVGRSGNASWGYLLLVAWLLAVGQQWHTAVNSAPQFKRLADPVLLPWLMPIFWVGFSFGLLLVERVLRACGVWLLLQLACAAGALALTGTVMAGSLTVLASSQFAAGVFWGFILCASIGLATECGQPLQTGRNTGALMATLAVAAMSRLGLAASGGLGFATVDAFLPVAAWCVALLFLLRLRSLEST